MTNYSFKPGHIVMCDFHGFIVPEMVKHRPVIIIKSWGIGEHGLATVVPLSSTKPKYLKPFHYRLPKNLLPNDRFFQSKETWLKGDMVNTVSHKRLSFIRVGKHSDGRRKYFHQRLNSDQREVIQQCLISGLGLVFR